MNDSSPQDDIVRRLFAGSLADEPLPPGALDRLTTAVLEELHRTPEYRTPEYAAAESEVPTYSLAPRRARGPFSRGFERMRAWLRSLAPRQSLALAGAGALAALLLFVGVSRITPRPLSMTAEVRGGEATVLSRHSDTFRVHGDGDLFRLRQGDQVLTDDGVVQFSHLPDQVAVVEPGAHVELTRLDEAGGGRQLALAIHDGVVHSRLATPLGTEDLYLITTSGVTVTAAGTGFTVEAVSRNETLVTTTSGAVTVTMGSEVVQVGPGEEVDAVNGRSLVVQPADGRYDGGQSPLLIAVGAAEGLPLYAGPRLDAPPVGRLAAGQSLPIQAHAPDGRWVQVCCVDREPAWVQIGR